MRELQNKYFNLDSEYEALLICGPDAERFLQGQLTNDISKLENNSFQLQCRLDRGGRVQSYFYLLKSVEGFIALVPQELKEDLKADLEKYIIMDDLTIEDHKITPIVVWGFENLDSSYSGILANFPAKVILEPCKALEDFEELNKETYQDLLVLGGAPVLGKNVTIGTLVTDTILNFKGVSLDKGCFLGQETVSKIETRRGGAYFPVAIKLKGDQAQRGNSGEKFSVEGKAAGKIIDFINFKGEAYLIVSLIRNHRVQGKELTLVCTENSFTGEVEYIPLGGEFNQENFVQDLYEKAVSLFQSDDEEEAINLLKAVVKLSPDYEDAYEAIGVILGRQEKFQEGIEFMDKVLEANPDSVMAHTNKSLFYMRLGKIEEAEEEKAQATVKSFSQYGKEAQQKKAKEEQKKAEEAEIERRFDMFKQVLEIDPDDNLANYGLADIYFQRGEAEKSIPLLEKVISVDKNYSVAYLLLGKVFLNTENKDKAREVFKRGIEIASAQGDLMPANEMQAKLSAL